MGNQLSLRDHNMITFTKDQDRRYEVRKIHKGATSFLGFVGQDLNNKWLFRPAYLEWISAEDMEEIITFMKEELE